MRQGQSKRPRGRNRKGMNSATRSYESNGPDVKIRGTAAHIADRYVQLARDAQSSGDIVAAENYFQHAEHYYRVLAASQPPFQQHPGFVRADQDDLDNEAGDDGDEANPAESPQPYVSYGREHDERSQQYGGPHYREQQPRSQPRIDEGPNGRDQQPEQPAQEGGSLPAFITGGNGDTGERERGEGGGENGTRYGRSRRRRYPRTIRSQEGEGGSEERESREIEQHAPRSEPETAPGE